jgi:phospholipase C
MFHRSIANQAIFAVMMLSTMLGTALMPAQAQSATTPIKHVVVIFQENVSFDHYFGVSTALLNACEPPHLLSFVHARSGARPAIVGPAREAS